MSIDLRYKPSWLPQISKPYTDVLKKLKEEGVKFKLVKVNPLALKPLQGIVFTNEITPKETVEPIWLSNNNDILDGHHRYFNALSNIKGLPAVRVDAEKKDAARVLNKIMDLFQFEEMNEVLAQNHLNTQNDPDSVFYDSQFLESLRREAYEEIDEDSIGGEKTVVNGYRKVPPHSNSSVGNFFMLNPVRGYKEYELSISKLLDTNKMNINFSSSQSPVEVLATYWFPEYDFSKLEKKLSNSKATKGNLINKAVTEKAKSMGFDAIKFGDIMILAF